MEDSISNSKKNKFRKLKYIKLIANNFKMQLGIPTEAWTNEKVVFHIFG